MIRQFIMGAAVLLSTASFSNQSMMTDAQWPAFRADHSNSGSKPYPSNYKDGAQPWSFQTSKGIFSTPVIDQDGNVFIGSADTYFYILSPKGDVIWSFKTGEIIDSAAVLSRDESGTPYVTLPSGDGFLYHFDISKLSQPKLVWKYDARSNPHPSGKGYDWFEANVTIGPDGDFYAGNTNWNYYALNGDGTYKWSFPAGNMNWSIASFDKEGDMYWSSLDFTMRKMDKETGDIIWRKRTLGFNVSSMALTDHDLVVAGSFDNYIYGLDTKTGKNRWTFKTDGHVYGSPAISAKDQLNRKVPAIYAASTDGFLYKLSHDGELVWKFDVGDVVRSSPVVGLSPEGNDIIYFGSGNGKLYAINGDGTFRWSFDTSPTEPGLAERNDLNGSPALGKDGVFIAGEHGHLWFVPYDYPLNNTDPKAETEAPKEKDGVSVRFMSAGAQVLDAGVSPNIAPSAPIILRVLDIQDGQRQEVAFNTWFKNTEIKISPEVPFKWEPSPSGDSLYIRPLDYWKADQEYTISLEGQLMSKGLKLGNLELGARKFKEFSTELKFSTRSFKDLESYLPKDGAAPTFEMYRLSVPEPSMLPSLNQIGFDSYHFLVSFHEIKYKSSDEGEILAWMQGAFMHDGTEVVPSADSEFSFPLYGTFKGNNFVLKGQGMYFEVAGIKFKVKNFEYRGDFVAPSVVSASSAAYVEMDMSSDLTYGIGLGVMGLLNNKLTLPANATYLTRPYSGAANEPGQTDLNVLEFSNSNRIKAGKLELAFKANDDRMHSLYLTNKEGKPYLLDYKNDLKRIESEGNTVFSLKIPRGQTIEKGSTVHLVRGVSKVASIKIN